QGVERGPVLGSLSVDRLPLAVVHFHAHAVLNLAGGIDFEPVDGKGEKVSIAGDEFGVGTLGTQQAKGAMDIGQAQLARLARSQAHRRYQGEGGPHCCVFLSLTRGRRPSENSPNIGGYSDGSANGSLVENES